MRGLPVSFPNVYVIFLTTMVILQIPMTANTHDISAPDATGRMVRAADILMNTLSWNVRKNIAGILWAIMSRPITRIIFFPLILD